MIRIFALSLRTVSVASLCLAASLSLAVAASGQTTRTFSCSGSKGGSAVTLSASTVFPPAVDAMGTLTTTDAFGFDMKTAPKTFSGGACASDAPFFFSMQAGDGDYRVTVVLGGGGASTTTLRAESRRLLLLEKTVAAGGSDTETFVVNVRTPAIAGASGAAAQVKLKPREIGALDWDQKLTLEFNGEHAAVRSIAITRVTDVPTVYLAGDSTVVDQDKEPWAAWGQMIPYFFGPGVSIANNAESGETIRSFVGERRYDKVMSTIKKGDFLLIQFAHNDMKPGGGFVSIADYKALMLKYITAAREKGATPILVTAMNRRSFDAEGRINQTLGEYPQATREVAAEQKLGLIDLNAMSKTLYEAMGPEGTLHAFVHYPANTFAGQTTELKDDTHFNAYGAYELAQCVVKSMREQHLPLAAYLRKDIAAYDPAHPDALATWHLPPSPELSVDTPYGR
jgi:lysophospholipase L1-like esterase